MKNYLDSVIKFIQITEGEKALSQLSLKNEKTDGYSLGDVLLLQKYERELKELSWNTNQIELLSPAFYGK